MWLSSGVSRSFFLTLSAFALQVLTASHGSGQAQSASIDAKSTASTESCESKTINYITHTLPQQCLRTAWSTANSTVQTGGNETPSTATAAATVTPDTGLEQSAGSETSTDPSTEQKATEAKKDEGQKAKADTKKEEEEEEEAGDLAVGSFMSFEEWKAMMLKKSGQDPAELKARKMQESRDAADATMNSNMESWGEDGEIALDFDVLSDKISEMAATASAKGTTAASDITKDDIQGFAVPYDGVAQYPKPKDAGKTCKERFSFSSFDGGALVVKTSPGAKNAKAILVENKDSYMLFPCAQENKFVIVELSEDILVDTVVLANFEFFSSMIRAFRVSVSDRYPVKIDKWKNLGTYQARNARDLQPFLIENPMIWAKYIRIEFLTHYGNEYYCPVSLLRVHGTRMLDSWKDAEAGVDDEEPAETITGPEAVPEQQPVQQGEAPPPIEPEPTNFTEQVSVVRDPGLTPWHPIFHDESHIQTCGMGTPTTEKTIEVSTLAHNVEHEEIPAVESTSSMEQASETSIPDESTPSPTSSLKRSGTVSSSSSEPSVNKSAATSSITTVPADKAAPENATHPIQESGRPVIAKTSMTPPIPPSSSKASPSSSKVSNTIHQSSKTINNNGHQNKTTSSTASAANPSPTVQESFFKTVSKRLNLLESNTTLSLQYIEDQSKFLQEALQKMERKHVGRVDAFLNNLNKTVLTELQNVRQQYDQIWQSTVIALETQREQSEREIVALSSRLNLLADEVVFQKRMAILQSVLLLCCLVLVIFSRGVFGAGTMMGNTLDHWATSTGSFMNPLASPLFPPTSPQSNANSPEQRRIGQRLFRSDRSSLNPEEQRCLKAGGQLSRSISYPTDKMLPLTPTSDFGGPSRDDGGGGGVVEDEDDGLTPTPTPPTIHVDEVENYFGNDEANVTPQRSNKSENEPPSDKSLESSPLSIAMNGESLVEVLEEDEKEREEDDEAQTSKPPLTSSPLSGFGSVARKPLPALPEDPNSY